MLHIKDEYIRAHLLQGAFGLEKENLRAISDVFFAHTKHPAPGDKMTFSGIHVFAGWGKQGIY